MHLTSAHRTPGRLAISSFLHSSDVLRVLVCPTTVQGWTDAEKELERVAEIIAVVAVERIGAVIDCGGFRSIQCRPTTQRPRFQSLCEESRSNFTRLRRGSGVAGHGLHG